MVLFQKIFEIWEKIFDFPEKTENKFSIYKSVKKSAKV